LLEQHDVQGKVERVRASLEDVFVASTRFNADDAAPGGRAVA
jgi:hypothetical protein